VHNRDEIQVVDLFPIPLHVRQQDKSSRRIRVFENNPLTFAALFENVVHPLEDNYVLYISRVLLTTIEIICFTTNSPPPPKNAIFQPS